MEFISTNARLVDRRRFEHLLGAVPSVAVLRALDAYRNDDGGYGTGLEPDLRAAGSQPGAALHALEVFEEIGPETTGRSVELCGWLRSVSLPDGGWPFALPIPDPTGCAPFWVEADHGESSLHITSAVTAIALRVARFDAAVAGHPWLAGATSYCVDRIRRGPPPAHALEFKFAFLLLDAAADTVPGVESDLARLRAAIPPDGRLHVGGGLDDEFVTPLDFAPLPHGPARQLFESDTVGADLDHIASAQAADGGWPSEWTAYSPAAALEWRGWLTVRAVALLKHNHRI